MLEEQNMSRNTGHAAWIRTETGEAVPEMRFNTDSTIPALESNQYIYEHYHASCMDMMAAAVRQADRIDMIIRSILEADSDGNVRTAAALSD